MKVGSVGAAAKFGVGAALGIVLWGLLRLFLAPCPAALHYHANWALIVDGQQLDLSSDRYMQSVAACAATDVVDPAARVHLHNNEGGVVHVHDPGVAWGHLFTNLGFSVGGDHLILDGSRRFLADGDRTLKFILNGFAVSEIGGFPVRAGDRLLVSYGPESVDHVLRNQFPRVASNAPSYDEREDPAGCAGAVGVGFSERLLGAFWSCPSE